MDEGGRGDIEPGGQCKRRKEQNILSLTIPLSKLKAYQN